MTAFTTSQIPSSVDTLEKLAYWTGAALATINSNLSFVEAENSTVPSCFFSGTQQMPDGSLRGILRVSVPISSSALTGTAKPWTYVEALSNVTIPAGFTS